MESEDSAVLMHRTEHREIAWIALGTLALVVGMIVFYFYPSPNGHRPTFWEFVAFWGRELLILGLVFVAIVIAGISKLWKLIQRGRENDRHAL